MLRRIEDGGHGQVRFSVLGSLTVVDGGRRVELGGLKQRAVLAALLIWGANRVVSADKLIDELWPGEPPPQARNALQTYVSNLRRALEPDRAPRDPARILRSQPPGYVLAVDPADYDAAHFEQLARDGRALLRDGDPRQARDSLLEALALWRGPAFADFAGRSFARAEADRLEERRAVALEDRIEADLALGEHATVVGELQHLVEEHPLREPLWGHLILALYRAGRQADALAAYQRCRETLDDELGIEPGPALKRLQLDVLQQASVLDLQPATRAGRSGAPQPGAIGGTPYLVYRDETGQDRAVTLDETRSPMTIGRGAGTDVWLSWDGRVSRLHAELVHEGGEWALVDAGRSSNGSFVNDEPVKDRRTLHDGDVLQVGDTVITYRHPLQSSAAMTRG